jgi:hypothetical protein
MAEGPLDLPLEFVPRARFDVVDLRSRLPIEYRDALAPYPSCLYWSAHTTAGFLDRSLAARLGPARVPTYVDALRSIFPEGAGYAHDRVECRWDLDAAQRAVEPRNADSHLAFIAGGLRPCVTHPNRSGEAVYFVDLDGVNEGRPRRRLTRVIGFRHEVVVAHTRIDVPMSRHPIESVNLKDPKLGIYDRLADFVAHAGVGTGRLHLALDPGERHAALTVNEYETLLMQHDLAEVLKDPLRFAKAKAQHVLEDPLAVPGKALSYARYDVVRVMNQLMEAFRVNESLVEKAVAKVMAVPARRFLRTRKVSFLASDHAGEGRARLVSGTYQSPILVQWQSAEGQARAVDISVVKLS